MISISVPGTAKLIQMALLNFIYLDILQTDKWLIPLLFKEKTAIETINENSKKNNEGIDENEGRDNEEEDEDTPLNEYFDENGFSSKQLIKNLGSTFVYFVILAAILILIPLLSLCSKWSSLLRRLTTWIKKQMIWNATLRFIIQQAPPISIACGINFFDIKVSSVFGQSLSSILSCLFLAILVASKFVVFFILRKH
jgi:hypothetical protein